jgi:hypothetical protein
VVKTGPGRTGYAWRAAQAELMAWAAENKVCCYLCRWSIDYALSKVVPNHPRAATAHHIVGLEQGGDPLDRANLAPAHRGCNTRHSNRLRALASAQRKSLAQLATGSRRW